ncbi:MAG: hypothetical protein DMG59_10715 [Acidobacteria bacterium]|nr:MAG: hypothetical protein DMG59_10715 [Acidobacteriota bacterium]
MPTVVTAQDGDTLCTLGINNGFPNCLALRALPENASLLNRPLAAGDQVTIPDLDISDSPVGTDQLHKFQIRGRQVGIRFVHGSRNLPFDQDLTLANLNISNFTTNRAGITEGATLASASLATFDQNADVDSDTFKVEVIDTRAPGSPLEVIVEPLRPTYDAGNSLNGHIEFDGDPHNPGSTRGFRSLIGRAHRLTSTRFRTGYLRLVVDDIDSGERASQTVLVTDMVINHDSQVEILDQDVRATYVLSDCPAAPDARCRVQTVVPIGRGRFVDVALHVLRATPSGVVETTPGGPADNGVVRLQDIRKRINIFCRRHWAQDLVKFRILLSRTVDLPSNMLTVSDATGSVASGADLAGLFPGRVGFTIRVQRFGAAPDSVHVVPPMNINAGDTPEATAGRIRDAINAIPGLSARVSVNPPEVGDPNGSADILITDSQNGRITITDLSSVIDQDSTQIVAVSDVNLNFLIRNGFGDYHVGHPHERNLYKMLDTGDDRIDIFVVQSFDGRPNLLGFTVTAQSDLDANRQPLSGMFNTIVMRADSADDTDNQPYALPHEIGHALLDCALHADSSRQLMFPTLINITDVNDPKRLIAIDPPATNWENMISRPDGGTGSQRIRMNTLARVLDKSSGLLHS